MDRSSLSQSRLQIADVDLVRLQMVAESIVHRLTPPLAIGLVGTLGVGKTRLVQMITAASSASNAEATSPTFTLLQTYPGCPRIHHLDAYRIADEDEFLELGVEELFDDAESFTIVEWADRVEAVMPRNSLWITLGEGASPNVRVAMLECEDAAVLQILRQEAVAWLATSVADSRS